MLKKNSPFALSVIFVFLLVSIGFPQENPDSTRFTFPKFSIQLRIVEFLRFMDFQGGSVSFKYHFNNTSALRVGLGFSADKRQIENSDYFYNTDSLDSQLNKDDSKIYTNISVQYIIYPNPNDDIKFYFGAGPFFGWANQSYNSTYWNADSGKILPYKDIKSSTRRFGLELTAGLEWFFMRNMSLLFDYSLTIGYRQGESTENKYSYAQPFTYIYKVNNSYIQWNTIKFGLSVYL